MEVVLLIALNIKTMINKIHINFDNILYIASKSLVSIVCGGFNGYILDKMIRDLFLLCAFFGIIPIKYGIHI